MLCSAPCESESTRLSAAISITVVKGRLGAFDRSFSRTEVADFGQYRTVRVGSKFAGSRRRRKRQLLPKPAFSQREVLSPNLPKKWALPLGCKDCVRIGARHFMRQSRPRRKVNNERSDGTSPAAGDDSGRSFCPCIDPGSARGWQRFSSEPPLGRRTRFPGSVAPGNLSLPRATP